MSYQQWKNLLNKEHYAIRERVARNTFEKAEIIKQDQIMFVYKSDNHEVSFTINRKELIELLTNE